MSIKSYVDELEEIQHEIKRNNIKNVQLRQRIKELEINIKTYLNEKGQPGLKYKGKAIIIEEKEIRPTKKKKDREQAMISLFEELGVSDPKDACLRLQDVQRGESVGKTVIKFKKLPKAT
jgi:hypothetical protein